MALRLRGDNTNGGDLGRTSAKENKKQQIQLLRCGCMTVSTTKIKMDLNSNRLNDSTRRRVMKVSL